MLTDQQLQSFKDLLHAEYDWPTKYLFKFIAPKDKVENLKILFPHGEIKERRSSAGNYVGLSVTLKMESPDVVIAVYQQASKIEGVLSL